MHKFSSKEEMVRFYSAHRSAAALKQTTAEMNNIDHRSAIGSRGTLDPGFPVLYMQTDIQSFPPQTPLQIERNSHGVAPKDCSIARRQWVLPRRKKCSGTVRQLRASTWSNSALDLILTDLSGLNGSESIHVLLEHPSVLSYFINDQYPRMVMVLM